jgi:adenylylsulfate kinase
LRKLLIMGLPGAGKTTLVNAIAPRLNAVVFNADEVRANINRDLGFSEEDRIEHARRMGWLCDQVVKTGGFAVADFICPTPATRAAYLQGGEAFVVWLNRIERGRFEDTNQLFTPPENPDIEVKAEGTPEFWAEKIVQKVRPIFHSKRNTALLIGRYQPFHEGHKALMVEALKRVGQIWIGVRDTSGTDERNPFSFEYVKARIEHALREHEGRFVVIQMPNITNVFYGRDVGYAVERIDLDASLEAVSATVARSKLGVGGGT